jgi:hypothetical protein
MRAITVYRWNDGGKTKVPVGVVYEKRKSERTSNRYDLLRLARRLFAQDAADAFHIIIDYGHIRRVPTPELSHECSTG